VIVVKNLLTTYKQMFICKILAVFRYYCQYWKSIMHVTYTIDFQYWQ